MKKITYVLSYIFMLVLLIGCTSYQASPKYCYDDSLMYGENMENLKRSIAAGCTDIQVYKGQKISQAINHYNQAKVFYEMMEFGNCKLENKGELEKYKKILDEIEAAGNRNRCSNFKRANYSELKFDTLEYRARYGDLRPYK